jgi:hypothetical protein
MVKCSELTAHVRDNFPPLCLRAIDLVFAIVVFASIVDQGRKAGQFTAIQADTWVGNECWLGVHRGQMHGSTSTCGFAIFVGVVTMLWDLFVIGLLFGPVCSQRFRIPRAYASVSLCVSLVLVVFW